jgi:hypothetical protein
LGDIDSIRVFQKNREPDTWAWAKEPSQAKDGFALTKGGGALGTKNVALALSVSGLIHVSEVLTVARQCENAIWHIQASEPKTDYVRSASQLAEFSALFRQAISEIQAAHGSDVTIHLFPAVPNSVAIECGRRLLPNANPAIKVYNSVAGIGWRFALDLLPANKA